MSIKTIAEVKQEINTNVTTNVGNRGITGQLLGGTMDDMLDTIDNEKANTTGYYEGLSVGLADNIISPDGVNDTDSWIYRTTAGSQDVSSGYASLKSIKGNTLVWNQLIQQNYSFTVAGLTITNVNGVISVNGTYMGSGGYCTIAPSITFPRNRTAYLCYFYGNEGYSIGISGYGGYLKPWLLYDTVSGNWNGTPSISFSSSDNGRVVNIPHLTMMFTNITRLFGDNDTAKNYLGLSDGWQYAVNYNVFKPFSKLFPSQYYAHYEQNNKQKLRIAA